MSFPIVNLCEDCAKGGPYEDSCTNLHIYYLCGALLTIIGSSFVIASYLCDGKLRQHPSILIFMRCVFDFLFGIVFIWLYFVPIHYLTCRQEEIHACNHVAPFMMFLFLCSNGYFAASIADLYLSLKNPFSSPHKLTNKMHGAVIITCFAITMIIRFADLNKHGDPFSYRPDIQFCWVTPVSEKGVNPINLIFIFGPILVIVASAFAVNIYAFLRLRKGLPDTFAIRMRSVQDSFSYSVGFTLYFIPLGTAYFCIWNQDRTAQEPEDEFRNNNNFHVAFAILLGCLGINDFLLWYCRKFRKRKAKQIYEQQMRKAAELETITEDFELDALQQKQRRKKKKKQRSAILKRPDLNEVLVPDRPEELYRINTEREDQFSPKHGDSAIKRMFSDISIKQNTGGNTINKALRREVLAYTTDGIAQSIDRGRKLCEKTGFERVANFEPRRKDYPTNMYDEHGATVQRFGIYIQYNSKLLYRNNYTNIVSDSRLISLGQCFGSNTDNKMIEENIYPINRLTRVSTKLVFNQEEYDSHVHALERIGKQRQFVDYAPLIFRYIRLRLMGMSDQEYKNSIIPSTEEQQKKVLDAKFGDGKSGAFFYFTHDSRFLVKTIKKSELELFIGILGDYVRHLKNNPNTILSRCVGLHSLRMYGLTMYYLVMENVFLAQLQPHEKYDLKGSWVGRGTDHRLQSGKLMKDNDLKRFVILNKKHQKQILGQLKRDTTFLDEHDLMDYSLLLGIYHMKITSDNSNNSNNSNSLAEANDENDTDIGDDMKYDMNMGYRLPRLASVEEDVNTYAGGVQAQVIEGPGIYYMGIIDYLQDYTLKKKSETFFKTYIQRKDGDGISCVNPTKYRKRFMNYMQNIIINDHDYFRELKIKPTALEQQNVYVYPSKHVVDDNMNTLRKKKHTLGCGDGQMSPTSDTSDINLEKVHSMDETGISLLNASLNLKT